MSSCNKAVIKRFAMHQYSVVCTSDQQTYYDKSDSMTTLKFYRWVGAWGLSYADPEERGGGGAGGPDPPKNHKKYRVF